MISLYRYLLPFRQPFELAGKRLSEREGIIVRFQDDLLDVLAEISPLPGFSLESIDEALDTVTSHLDEIQMFMSVSDPTSWSSWLEANVRPASVRFGLDVLMLQSLAARGGNSLQQYLSPISGNRIGINAVLGILPADELEEKTSQLINDGYRTIKYKVGNPEPYVGTWQRIRDRYPRLNMRFDANGSWRLGEALGWIKLLEPIQPEYVEQPLAVGYEFDMAQLQRTVNFPIAFDESARDLESVENILQLSPQSVIILKPMLLGSIAELIKITDAVSSKGSSYTITTLIESGVGRNIVASIASAFAHPGVDHGLGTGSLFDIDILTDLTIVDGRFLIDSNPCSRIDSSLLESFRIH